VRVPDGETKLGVLATAKTWAFDVIKGVGQSHGDVNERPSLIGQPAPDFELSLLDGSQFKLREEIGKKVIVLDFWATWCGPCITAMPDVMAAVKAFEGKGVRLVGINQQESAGEVERFVEARGWKLDVALDEELLVRERYGVKSIPTTIIIGKDGKVSMMHTGSSPGLKEELTADIRSALE